MSGLPAEKHVVALAGPGCIKHLKEGINLLLNLFMSGLPA